MNHHLLPTDPEQLQALRETLTLCLIPGVGPHTRRALLDRFASAADVLSASAEQLAQVPGVGSALSTRIVQARTAIDADREIQLCRQHGIHIVRESDRAR